MFFSVSSFVFGVLPSKQKIVYNGKEVTEEFVETEYYKDLNCVDKEHHTVIFAYLQICSSPFRLYLRNITNQEMD